MKKLYEVIFVDEYNNHFLCGFYKSLDDSIKDLNGYLEVYENGKYVLKPGDIKVYVSTFGECFNYMVADLFMTDDDETPIDDLQCAMIVGFVHEFSDENYELACKLLVE